MGREVEEGLGMGGDTCTLMADSCQCMKLKDGYMKINYYILFTCVCVHTHIYTHIYHKLSTTNIF